MKALEFRRKPGRFAAAAVAGRVRPGSGAAVGPLSLAADVDPPEPPDRRLGAVPTPAGRHLRQRPGHHRRPVAAATSSPSCRFPFTPGHEVVGELDDGSRAVLIPVLHCGTRGIDPVCPACAAGRTNHCERIAFGHLEPGLQTGFCRDTGGGWSDRDGRPPRASCCPSPTT